MRVLFHLFDCYLTLGYLLIIHERGENERLSENDSYEMKTVR